MLPITLTQRLGHPGNRFLIILIVQRRPVTDRGLSTLNGSKKRPRVEKKAASTGISSGIGLLERLHATTYSSRRFSCLLPLPARHSARALIASAAFAVDAECVHAGKSYSSGATICECPSMSGDGWHGTGKGAKITSRRLVCNKTWQPDNTMCLDLDYAGNAHSALEDFPKYHRLYCGVTRASSP